MIVAVIVTDARRSPGMRVSDNNHTVVVIGEPQHALVIGAKSATNLRSD
jgi:hypothetical protein